MVKDKNDGKLHPTELGMEVCEGLSEYVKSIMDVKFTSILEEQLDDIADGNLTKEKMLSDFYPGFCKEIKNAEVEMEKPVELSEKCPKCGGTLLLRHGKYGKFKSCSNYPDCNYSYDERPKPKVVEGTCPECGSPLVEKNGKYGTFIGCSNYPNCKYIQQEKKKDYGKCPICDGVIGIRRAKKGTFYGCSNYPDCKFATWYEPTDKKCPKCGYPLGDRKTKAIHELKCTNKDCDYSIKR